MLSFLPYLCEATDLYTQATGDYGKLMPVESVQCMKGESGTTDADKCWHRVAIDRELLVRRTRPNTTTRWSARGLLDHTHHFGAGFDLRTGELEGHLTYESKQPIPGYRTTAGRASLVDVFDRSLFAVDRRVGGGLAYVTLSNRQDLMSWEAVTFVLLHALSEIVRYRPYHAEEMLGSQHFWVLTAWVDRACENFLLTMATRITGLEHRLD